ncbi:uncharacterized protein HMPREF1541_08821 [Cyphellophora europaea CBS 101466]|uniref:Dol-P-Man:Man(5)GlcNAc(2)-PP-Dol alpha-1,3-mannosyltransferase n=1 Tax=Cyphellophora europaea (strain CBS 101466) TaxID=1220924 RepID=W2RLG1_CYPE1|nr:uncharacterized protein HMPREF1541_08821 [Cyphellophora europaea CBS 101466]ETN36543.1 hypothetical protein HMPREF1541_08821 [Cyphellophora europaea CBS 101466]
MSKLSEGLKALINAAHARPNVTKAPTNIKSIYSQIAESARSHNVGTPAWLTISTATTMTMNSPASLLQLHSIASQPPSTLTPTESAELMREVGLKCISFNGIPRVINNLGAFRDGLPKDVQAQLATSGTRQLSSKNADAVVSRGRALWNSIYRPFEDKLVDKLAASHPNLPIHIISAHYGTLLSDPDHNMPAQVGRVLASLVAIACLRAQTGVGPQVLSHVFGLRKAFEDGSAEEDLEGGEWLASEEGNKWILESVDAIVGALGGEQGTTFAPGLGKEKAKL